MYDQYVSPCFRTFDLSGVYDTSDQTVMSGLAAQGKSAKIDVFRLVQGRSFASVHGVSVVNLWSVPGTAPAAAKTDENVKALMGDLLKQVAEAGNAMSKEARALVLLD